MNEERNELLFDLLTQKAVYGLNELEQQQLDDHDTGTAQLEFQSLETTAAAISMIGLATDEPLPAHLRSRILADANQYVGLDMAETIAVWPKTRENVLSSYAEDDNKPATSWFTWFGWAAAAAACVALAVNIWFTRFQPNVEIAQNLPPVVEPRTLSAAELRDEMLRVTTDTVKATWAIGNMKELTQLVGDVVWSDEKQTGYMRIRGLPVNDVSKETYQLWIFDKTQDKATPIDGGTFDVKSDGEAVIPINAKLKAQGPEMFAITVEKPGGVVVSKRGKLAALATVETKAKTNS